MSDELAKLYIRYQGKRYRVKVFENAVGIEQQPGGENCLLRRDESSEADAVYDDDLNEWSLDVLLALIDRYSFT